MLKKYCLFFLFIINAAFAGFPSPVKSANIRIVYIVDMFENEVVDTEMPRSVLDSILLDVDSVFFAPLGACDCDCAGGDIFFYLSKKKILEPFSRQISLTAFVVKLATAWILS